MTTLFATRRICGFGPDLKFGVLWGGNPTGMPGWEQESFDNTIHIPGGNVNETFLMGLGVARISYGVVLDTAVDYNALLAARQTQDTLTVYARMCEVPAREVVWFGQTYKEIDDVLLLSVSQISNESDEARTCVATFQMQEWPV